MKSKRRHELEQNELADWLGAVVAGIRPYQNLILAVVLILAIGGAVYAWWARQSSTKTTEAWDQVYAALDSGSVLQLGAVADKYPNTSAGHWAAVVDADQHLAYGCNLLFSNKASANEELRKALQYYSIVLDQSREAPLRQRATFGLARAHEALGDLEKAENLYRQIGNDWPKGAYAEAAASRLADLQKPATKAMYDRFAKFDPKPAMLNEPGTPGQRPPFKVEDLPEEGPLFEPGKAFNLKPKAAEEKGTEEKEGHQKGAEQKKVEENKADEKKPENSQSTPESSPESAKPAAPEPAEKPTDPAAQK